MKRGVVKAGAHQGAHGKTRGDGGHGRLDLGGRFAPAIRALEVAIEGDDREVELFSGSVLIRVIEIEAELLPFDDLSQVPQRERDRDHGPSREILSQGSEHRVLTPPEQEEANGMNRVVRNEQLVHSGGGEHGPCLFGSILLKHNFENDVGVEKEPHSSPLRHRRI